MKKILKKTSSVILALCIIFCMGINVQAATHKLDVLQNQLDWYAVLLKIT